MLRSMYGRSRSNSFGCTEKRWTRVGHSTPASSAPTSQNPAAEVSNRTLCCWFDIRVLTSIISAATAAMPVSSRSAGMRAVTSVYVAPVTAASAEKSVS